MNWSSGSLPSQRSNVSTKSRRIEVRGITVEIVRKDIKNLHLGVYPPNGRVRVAAPRRLTDEAIRLAVISRLGWIRRQQAKFENQERQSKREMVSGESHYVEGRRYRLQVVEKPGAPAIKLKSGRIMLQVPAEADRDRREKVLNDWYRARLRHRVAESIEKWEQVTGLKVRDWRIRKMKTRWGTCNASAGRIWINLELAKKSPRCLEYIMVHEMVHMLERHHNENFKMYMDRFMPQWRLHRDELNRNPLSHESWSY